MINSNDATVLNVDMEKKLVVLALIANGQVRSPLSYSSGRRAYSKRFLGGMANLRMHQPSDTARLRTTRDSMQVSLRGRLVDFPIPNHAPVL
jgi:hypothetical protein